MMSLRQAGRRPHGGRVGFKGQPGMRWPMLLLAAIIAIGAGILLLQGFEGPQSAQAAGPSMSLRVYSDKAKSQLVCDKGPVLRKCDISAGTSFSIDVIANTPPEGGYTGYQAVLGFPSLLTLQQQPEGAENVWPQCDTASEFKDEPGEYRIRCKGGQSQYTGPLANVQFVCDPEAGSGRVDLVGGEGAFVSYYTDQFATLLFLKAADSITINCVIPPTPTFTPPPTATPTHTPTPTPVKNVSMSLRMYADKAKSQPVECEGSGVHRKCDIIAGNGFSIDVIASSPPVYGYTAYQVAVQYSSNLTLQQQDNLPNIPGENRWPDCNTGNEYKDKPGIYRLFCKSGPGLKSFHSEALANVQFVCQGGSGQIDLLAGTGAASSNVSYYWWPNPFTSDLNFLKSQNKGGREVADSLLINCLPDSDGDGCIDAWELGPDPQQGGLRDPSNPWDFYDVAGPGGPPDRYIDLAHDILGVMQRYSAAGGTYDANFDRGPSTGPNPWNMTAPDGTIDLPNDILGVMSQYQHDCRF